MKVVDFLKLGREFLTLLTQWNVRCDDCKHIEMYEEYVQMRGSGEKVEYILAVLADKYGMSASTAKRIIKRLSQEALL